MQKRKFVLLLVAMLALAGLVVGCGGGGSSSSGSTANSTSTSPEAESSEGNESSDGNESSESSDGGVAPTKAAFIKEADAVCAKAETELVEEVKEFAKEKGISLEKEASEDQQAELFREVILPNIGRQAEEIAALTPPEGDQETIEDLTDTLSSEVAEVEEESGPPAEDALAEATKKAKAYGFKSCGS